MAVAYCRMTRGKPNALAFIIPVESVNHITPPNRRGSSMKVEYVGIDMYNDGLNIRAYDEAGAENSGGYGRYSPCNVMHFRR